MTSSNRGASSGRRRLPGLTARLGGHMVCARLRESCAESRLANQHRVLSHSPAISPQKVHCARSTWVRVVVWSFPSVPLLSYASWPNIGKPEYSFRIRQEENNATAVLWRDSVDLLPTNLNTL